MGLKHGPLQWARPVSETMSADGGLAGTREGGAVGHGCQAGSGAHARLAYRWHWLGRSVPWPLDPAR
jgi:hypothetical protein